MPYDYQFGAPWAADGETRPSRTRTVLAHASGVGDGALLVQEGTDIAYRYWILASEWQAWLTESKAQLYVAAPDEPGEAGP
jgi:hypothetical protein